MKITGHRNQCSGCGKYFNTNTAFDKHRVGPFGDGPFGTSPSRRCLTKEEMSADARWSIGAEGFWRFSPQPGRNPFTKTA